MVPANPVLRGWSSYSQFDEDGIIRECLSRISGLAKMSNTFVEVGCGDGLENNSHQLLIDGCSGVWIDADPSNIEKIKEGLGSLIFSSLLVIKGIVDRETSKQYSGLSKAFLNVESIDLFSLDIDGNDYHVCGDFLSDLRPKLVCVEYNAVFPPPTRLVMSYSCAHNWAGDSYFGASLQSWVDFFGERSYGLVCCNGAGSNAFFVRSDFFSVFEMQPIIDLYRPPKYDLIRKVGRHPSTLKWLRQVLTEGLYDYVEGEKVRKVEVSYGEMFVFEKDTVIGASLLGCGSFQEEKINDVMKFLKSTYGFLPKSFVDIGANIGTHSVFSLKCAGFQRVEAFEPDSRNFSLLMKNMCANGLVQMVTAYNIAFSDRSGVVQMELSMSNFGDHRIAPQVEFADPIDGENDRPRRTVTAVTLDEFFVSHQVDWSNNLVWIDTQGHEGHIFNGGKDFLGGAHGPKFIVSEFWPYGLARSGGKNDYFSFLNSCCEIYDINHICEYGFRKTYVEELINLYDEMLMETRKDFHPHTDLLLIRG